MGGRPTRHDHTTGPVKADPTLRGAPWGALHTSGGPSQRVDVPECWMAANRTHAPLGLG
jgi:hypothetical protein